MKDPRFPELMPRQISILKDYGTIENYDQKTRIFEQGDLRYDFFVILKGEVIIEDPYNNNRIVAHGKNEFTGDSGMLSDRASHFHAIAKPGTSVLRITPERLKQAIGKHSDLSDLLLNAFLQRQETVLSKFIGGIKLVGTNNSKETYTIRDFMDKNHIWYHFLNVDSSKEALTLLQHFNLSKDDLPILINSDAKVCKNPSLDDVARYAGILTTFENKVFDLLIVGAGPAGLAASVYASSEGLNVVTIDSNAPGGQAGKSSKIENYLGFPTGISGKDLANRAYVQAQKFGCIISIPHKAQSITHSENHFTLSTSNGKKIKTKAIIAATGANYRQLPVKNIEDYEGNGIYYSATDMDITSCSGELVGVVGGGNSAGQAALFLAHHAKKVYIILRGNNLGAKMSSYLTQRIEAAQNITILLDTEITTLYGMHHLESVILKNKEGITYKKAITNLFTFIGAKPHTEWTGDLIIKDKKGFICTGSGINDENLAHCTSYRYRKPQSLETSISGFFAVGDVRKGSTKRVASAVGEGAMAISQVHQFLGEHTTENSLKQQKSE